VPVEPDVTETTTDPVEEIIPVTEQETEAPVKEVEKKPEEKKPVEVKKKEEPKPKPPKVLYPGNQDAKNPASNSQGDKTDANGDQGDKNGNVDARALYGKLGGGGGGDSMLEMTGWKWDSPPDPKENTSESGKIVFEIIIDERGEVISVRPLNYTVSVSLMKIYQKEVEKLTFSKTSSGKTQASYKGKITFKIEAK
jgi:hypothetical protein